MPQEDRHISLLMERQKYGHLNLTGCIVDIYGADVSRVRWDEYQLIRQVGSTGFIGEREVGIMAE